MEVTDAREARRVSRLVAGALLIGVGVLFVLGNLGLVRPPRAAELWPLVLVWVGITRLAANRVASGVLLLGLGAVLQLERLGVVFVSLDDLWPALLIALGAGLIADSLFAPAGSRRRLREVGQRSELR